MVINTERFIINTDTNEVYSSYSKRYLKLSKTQKGYLMFNGGLYIHRLVLENSFIGPHRPTDQVDHIDNNIYNNDPSNLRWVSKKYNVSRKRDGFYDSHYILNLDDEHLFELFNNIRKEIIRRHT